MSLLNVLKYCTYTLLFLTFASCDPTLLETNNSNNSNRGVYENKAQKIIDANAPLTFTKHALCRMKCRGIDEGEIREVLEEGHINHKKSDINDTPCATYAIEDVVQSGQRLRIVFGKCEQVVKVITCIDLDSDVECDCN